MPWGGIFQEFSKPKPEVLPGKIDGSYDTRAVLFAAGNRSDTSLTRQLGNDPVLVRTSDEKSGFATLGLV